MGNWPRSCAQRRYTPRLLQEQSCVQDAVIEASVAKCGQLCGFCIQTMRNISLAFSLIYLAMSLALGSCGSAAAPRLSQADAIRIAEEKVSHDLGGSLETYHRISASYLADDRKWIVTYRAAGSGS